MIKYKTDKNRNELLTLILYVTKSPTWQRELCNRTDLQLASGDRPCGLSPYQLFLRKRSMVALKCVTSIDEWMWIVQNHGRIKYRGQVRHGPSWLLENFNVWFPQKKLKKKLIFFEFCKIPHLSNEIMKIFQLILKCF